MKARLAGWLSAAAVWEEREVYWTMADVLKLAVLVLALTLGISYVLWSWFDSDVSFMLARTLAVLIALLVHRYYRFWPGAQAFGMTARDYRIHFMSGVWWGLGAKFLPLIAILLILIPVGILMPDVLAGLPDNIEPNVGIHALELFSWQWMVAGLLVVVVAPLYEEVLMRGILYPWLRQRSGRKWAILLSSAAFALLHGIGPVLIPTFIAGVMLALLYEKKGALSACVIAHGVFNLISFVAQSLPGFSDLLISCI